jgi:hypothetical protein
VSADNYYLVRPDGLQFVVTMGFESDDNEPAISERDSRFDTLADACRFAFGEYSEYGVTIADECWE